VPGCVAMLAHRSAFACWLPAAPVILSLAVVPFLALLFHQPAGCHTRRVNP